MVEEAQRRRWAAVTPEMTRPTLTLILMIAFLIMIGVIGWLVHGRIAQIFAAHLYLNIFIFSVFLIGVAYVFWQVLRLFRSVEWMEAFLAERPGFDLIEPPPLLASMAALLRERENRRRLSAFTVRTILDSVGTRLDESRDFGRYIAGALIFLGLLGTFWGLSRTVPAVVDTIRSLAPEPGDDGTAVFGRLVTGLEEQLGGMGTAFAAALLGLTGSLIVGFLDILAGRAQNRFYQEFEEALSGIADVSRNDEGVLGRLAPLLERNSESLERLAHALIEGEAIRNQSMARLDHAARNLDLLAERFSAAETTVSRLLDSQNALGTVLREASARNRGVLGGMDEATRAHIRNLDTQILRLTEEVAAGRQDAVAELRAELKQLTRAVQALGGGS
ncbi:hypothetical protein [Neomegalonema perideroedes]|uniref:hypothetical protein n=1 Tax=Neomegalonema perideroedes TaxID=217219 RepID=UPI000380713E|nr:hypothetical protein [Neomegalonema perideroedes]